MPPRKGKDLREQVVYAASKAKTPAYKPLRPNRAARSPTTHTGSSLRKTNKPTLKKAALADPTPTDARNPITFPHSEEDETGSLDDLTTDAAAPERSDGDDVDVDNDEEEQEEREEEEEGQDEDNDKGLPTLASLKAGARTKKRKASALLINDNNHHNIDDSRQPGAGDGGPDLPLPPSPSDGIPGIPPQLLLRLLHENFTKIDTKIDKHALQVVQTYVEVFVREAIARCVAAKKEAAEKGEVGESDSDWLELEDLEKIGVGMMLDF